MIELTVYGEPVAQGRPRASNRGDFVKRSYCTQFNRVTERFNSNTAATLVTYNDLVLPIKG
ncbi:hypothetical protein COL17_01560 [Priestia megaterium]|jgi:hypothetical protein|nr:hypothetical protein COL17_01560 [Priestia megaterium]